MQKPGRPLGLSIAILLSTLLYTIVPVASVVFYASLQQHFADIDFLEGGGAAGGSIMGPGSGILALRLTYGLIFFVIAILAWRGKPSSIRWIFILAVITITAISIGIYITTQNGSTTLDQGIDSAQAFGNSALTSYLVTQILVTLYVLWYVNRGPARAFYRGYFIPEPEQST